MTDEEFRLRFLDDPEELLFAMVGQGFELTAGEVEALVRTERAMWTTRPRASTRACNNVG